MKVLHIINSLNTGGAEKLLSESLPLYNKRGIKTDLLLLNGDETPLLKELKKQNCCNIYTLGKGLVYNPLLIFKLIPYIKRYDIIHAHLFPSLYWLSIAKILSFTKTKIIYTEHSTNNKRRNFWLFEMIDKLFYYPYSRIITIADEVDNNIKKHLRFNSSKFLLINNGVNTIKYQKAKAYSNNIFFSEDSIILLQISSFRKPKDQITLIKALKELPEQYKLLLVGDGPLIEANKELVKELNLQSRVKFLGIRMDVPELLKTSDITVLSSNYEGLSLSSIEAMAAGKPFIASDVPGLREIVKDAGILFTKGDYKELANHILDLKDKKYYNKIAGRGERRAKQYDIHKMVEEYIELYNMILKD